MTPIYGGTKRAKMARTDTEVRATCVPPSCRKGQKRAKMARSGTQVARTGTHLRAAFWGILQSKSGGWHGWHNGTNVWQTSARCRKTPFYLHLTDFIEKAVPS